MVEDDPENQVFFAMLAGLYQNHPIRTNIIGTVQSISQITADTLYACHRAFYDPANMALCVAGDVDPIFPVEGVMEAYHQIEKQYQAANAPDACKMLVGHGPHRFFNKEAWDIIDSFFKD